MIVPVILSGGDGTRLWPMSRRSRPKQYLPLLEEISLFQMTLRRISHLDEVASPVVVCNEEHRFVVAEQMRELGFNDPKIILEPEGRNTASAVALAALYLQQTVPNALMLVLPADHVIKNEEVLRQALKTAAEAARQGKLVTFGVVPTRAETGFGYIKPIEQADIDSGDNNQRSPAALSISHFVEKPSQHTAERYVECGDYLWNSGMFVFEVETILGEFALHSPTILNYCHTAMMGVEIDRDFVRIESESYLRCESLPIDVAIVEKTNNAVVVPLKADWADMGSWRAIEQAMPKDQSGNSTKGDVLLYNTQNSYAFSENRLIALLGLSGVTVVDSADAVLVADNRHLADVKVIVEHLRKNGRAEADEHNTQNRHWGSYEVLNEGTLFKVKFIKVKPGGKLSLQKHQYRSEHWVVVKGTADITLQDDAFTLSINQSAFIPVGALHSLANSETRELQIVEIQVGEYLQEDDIVRIRDE